MCCVLYHVIIVSFSKRVYVIAIPRKKKISIVTIDGTGMGYIMYSVSVYTRMLNTTNRFPADNDKNRIYTVTDAQCNRQTVFHFMERKQSYLIT